MERLSIGCSNTERARAAAAAAAQEAMDRGQVVWIHALSCPVQGGWAIKAHQAQKGLFLEDVGGKLIPYHFDRCGVRQRNLKAAGEEEMLSTKQSGMVEYIPLSQEQWARQIAREAVFGVRLRRLTVAVEGEGVEQDALRAVLQAAGCRVEARWHCGIPAFWMGQGGFVLFGRNERGAVIDSGQLLAVVTLIEMEQGCGQAAFPAGYSAAAHLVAAGFGKKILRLDTEGAKAYAVYARLPWLREAPSAAVRICRRMMTSGQRLETLLEKTPQFHIWERELSCDWEQDTVMEVLSGEHRVKPEGKGFCLHTGECWLHMYPKAGGSAVRVVAEGPDLETAEELCDLYVRRLSGKILPQEKNL